MNAESVASVILCSDHESDWNRSDEEGEDCFGDDSLCVDRLSMELVKWQINVVSSLNFTLL